MLFVFSTAGTVARRFALEPPSTGSRFAQMRIIGGQILVEYSRPEAGAKPGQPGDPVSYPTSRNEYSRYDAFTGEKIADYIRDPRLQGSLACFDGHDGFDFLTQTESGTRTIIRASPR